MDTCSLAKVTSEIREDPSPTEATSLETSTVFTAPIVACIPAYNEEKYIAKVVLATSKYVDKIIVCDDGSDDMTADIAQSLGVTVVRHDKRLGKGAALKSLFDASKKVGAEVVVTLDGDGQHNPKEIPDVVQPILAGKADISVGSRFRGHNHVPRHRAFGNSIITSIANLRSTQKVTDSTCGFRAYSNRAIREVDIRENGMGVDSQILMDARAKKLKIVETGVSVTYGSDTSTYHPTRLFAKIIMAIVRYASEEHPLLILGVPGLAFLLVGLTYGALLLHIYDTTGLFILSYALLAIGGVIVGLLTTLISVVLFAMKNFLNRLRGTSKDHNVIVSD